MIYAHGGGFVTGNLDTDHGHCVELAHAADCLVVSVGYRLAPEHPCPAALDDVEASLRFAVDNCAELDADAHRLAVMGRDAGAALVAGLAQRMFDEEGPPILVQILHQPMLDSDATPSRREFQRTPVSTVRRCPGPGPITWATPRRIVTTFRRTGRIWKACRRHSSAARRSTLPR
ncbi:esterase LipW [Mycobacterium kansasii]|uniref:Esterase LipW n=1 Tax=Mycobacterium kansasii TaxID=1768 RepID=A0A1V3XJQ7_MYCKA|nr:esterase LipW [Mycobacterium kansasii]